VFRNLRERFGIQDEEFLNSLIKCPRAMEAHKSGAKCFLSYDGIYVINILATDQVSPVRFVNIRYGAVTTVPGAGLKLKTT
jgi:hypothetical protein